MCNNSLDFIIGSMNAWQYKKEDKVFSGALLSEAYSFDITVPQLASDTDYYHVYVGLDLDPFLRSGDDKGPRLYMHIIPAAVDKVGFIKDNFTTYQDFITTSIVDFKLLTDTIITSEEAMIRMDAWPFITEWIKYNQVFNVFKVPAEDLHDPSGSAIYKGYFAMKHVAGIPMPDIVICKTSASAAAESFYDMARTCPPFKSQDDMEALGLLEFVYVNKAF